MPLPNPNDLNDDLHNREILRLLTDDGQEFLLEARSPGGMEKVSGLSSIPVSDFVNSIKSISQSVVNSIKEISPDKFSVEFGIEASFEAGKLLALLCSGGAKANLKITLEWTKPKPPFPDA